MTCFAFHRLIAVFALTAILGAPLSSVAAPRATAGRSEARPAATAPLFTWLWSLLAEAWTKEGCHIDPYGRCITNSRNTTDAGCSIDPYGRCLPGGQDTTDNGCSIDPFGRCL